MDTVVVKSTKAEFLGRRKGGAPPTTPSIFIAYRMNNADSRKFRADLEGALNEVTTVKVLDGNVDEGLPWAEAIRKRIGKAKLLVADITGPSREVLFEYGFARNKYVIPVVHRRDDQKRLPKWMTVVQLPPPYEGGQIARLAESIATKVISRPEGHRQRPSPAPGRALWIQDERSAWADVHFERTQNRLSERSLTLERRLASDIESDEELRDCLRASLVIACIDGLTADYLGHFLLGDVVGRPSAGVGTGKGQSIQRLGIALQENPDSGFVADSVTRAAGRNLKVVGPDELTKTVASGADRYHSFLRGG